MELLNLPLFVFRSIIDQTLEDSTIFEGLSLRRVNRVFDKEVECAYFDRIVVDIHASPFDDTASRISKGHLSKYLQGRLRQPHEGDYSGLFAKATDILVDIQAVLRDASAASQHPTKSLKSEVVVAVINAHLSLYKGRWIYEGLNPYKVHNFELSPLEAAIMTAVSLKDVDAMKRLISRIPPHTSRATYLISPLTKAAEMSYCDGARILLDSGADMKLGNGTCYPPLEYAIMRGRLSIVELFLNPCYKLDSSSEAYEDEMAEAIKVADPDEGLMQVFYLMWENKRFREDLPRIRNRYMTLACSVGNEELVRMLMEDNIDCAWRPRGEPAPVWVAAQAGNVGVLRVLLTQAPEDRRSAFARTLLEMPGLEPPEMNLAAKLQDEEGSSNWRRVESFHRSDPFLVAAVAQHPDVLQALFDHLMSLEKYGQARAAGLFKLERPYGNLDVKKCLIRNGLRLDVANCGRVAMKRAIENENKIVVDFLVENGVSKENTQDIRDRGDGVVAVIIPPPGFVLANP